MAFVTLLSAACSTPKQINYFQDLSADASVQVNNATEITIRPKDKLSIVVNAQDLRLTNLFNLPVVSQQVGMEGNSNTARGISGYTVDSAGNIVFPVLGQVHVAGMTREQLAQSIKERLTSDNLVKDPVVTVEFMNLNVTVLGEVNNPGRYAIDRDKLTLLDALGMAGDLTIYGRRDKVLVMRNEGGVQRAYTVNLCSAAQTMASPVYFLRQDDVVYVEPNDTRARQSTVNGNNVRSTSFWISLASLMTSIAVLIAK